MSVRLHSSIPNVNDEKAKIIEIGNIYSTDIYTEFFFETDTRLFSGEDLVEIFEVIKKESENNEILNTKGLREQVEFALENMYYVLFELF